MLEGGKEGGDHVEGRVPDVDECVAPADMEDPVVRVHVVLALPTLSKDQTKLGLVDTGAEMVSKLEYEVEASR